MKPCPEHTSNNDTPLDLESAGFGFLIGVFVTITVFSLFVGA